MKTLSTMFAVAFAAALQACAVAPPPTLASRPVEQRRPVTILIGIDGFRPDYLDRGITPRMTALADAGVRASMTPSFPTKTFPNHYTLVTGLHPDRHGIVANRFEDPAHPDDVFTMARLEPFWWDEAEPIWVAAERAGIRTATMFWPGSNARVRGTYPSDWQQFSQAVTNRQRVAAIVDWMRRPPATRPRFATLYFDTVDTAGHRFGPDSDEVNAAIREIDAAIGTLVDELAALRQPANLVVVADHGMAAIDASRVIDLAAIVPLADIRVIEAGPYLALHPAPGRETTVAAALLRPHDHMDCWRKEALPGRLAYGRNPRVPPNLCIAESGWTIVAEPPEHAIAGGAHGYDNADNAMRALFLASGPAFRASPELAGVDSVDVEPLLRRLIGLPPVTGRDGSAEVFDRALRAD